MAHAADILAQPLAAALTRCPRRRRCVAVRVEPSPGHPLLGSGPRQSGVELHNKGRHNESSFDSPAIPGGWADWRTRETCVSGSPTDAFLRALSPAASAATRDIPVAKSLRSLITASPGPGWPEPAAARRSVARHPLIQEGARCKRRAPRRQGSRLVSTAALS